MRTLYVLSIMLAISVPAFSQEVIVGDTARLPDPTSSGWYECQFLDEKMVTTSMLTPILRNELGMMGMRFFTKSQGGFCSLDFYRGEQYVIWYSDTQTRADPLRYVEWYKVDLITGDLLVRGYQHMLDEGSGTAMSIFDRKAYINFRTRRASR